MTKKNFMLFLVLLVIIGGAIGGAIVFLSQRPNAAKPALSAISAVEVRYETKV